MANLLLSAIYCQFPYFSWNNLSFHYFLTQMVFRSDKVPKVSIVPFFHFHIIVLNLPVCFELLYWKLPSHCLTIKSSLVYFQFHLRDDWRCYQIYAACCLCYFQFVFAAGVLFPCTWFLIRYGQTPWFRSFSILNIVIQTGSAKNFLKALVFLCLTLPVTVEFLMNFWCMSLQVLVLLFRYKN